MRDETVRIGVKLGGAQGMRDETVRIGVKLGIPCVDVFLLCPCLS